MTADERAPVVIVGGFLSGPGDYRGWQQVLAGPVYRRQVFVTEISRQDWLTTRDDTFRPQLVALDRQVARARQATGAAKVWLVCHSAGGRIARLWMGEPAYNGGPGGGFRQVAGVIFLGSPYTTLEPWARRSSAFANEHYPGAFYSDIKYVSVVGKAVFGRADGTISERLAYRSYQALDPAQPRQWGDGIMTISAATVPGAENHVLDGIYHVGVLGRPGYSSPAAMKVWAQSLL